MGAPTQAEVETGAGVQPSWTPVARIAFRFAFVYFLLYSLTTQIITGLLPIPLTDDLSEPGSLAPIRLTVLWVAEHVFHVKTGYTMTGSGDKTFDWVLNFCVLACAAAGTVVWTLLDRRRGNYAAMHKWFHLFLRFALGSEMIVYGMVKLVPLQMPFPFLTRLVEPYGNFSPMGVLWSSTGAMPAYEMFAGSAELAAGILLVFPRTSMLGALVALADATEVFALNMTYDVPVKLLSFHLILMALVLLAPEMPRIARFFLSGGSVEPSRQPRLFRGARWNRVAFWAPAAFGLALLASNAFGAWRAWHQYGAGAPRSPLYGIWDVEQLRRDGEIRPPLLTDEDRWRRVIFEVPTRVGFERLDDRLVRFGCKIDTSIGAITLTRQDDAKWKANLKFQRTAPERMTIAGEMDGHRVEMDLRLFDRSKFLLVNRGFHWISENPFNR